MPVSAVGGRARVWDLATRERIGPGIVLPSAARTLAVVPGDRLVVGFGCEVAVVAAR